MQEPLKYAGKFETNVDRRKYCTAGALRGHRVPAGASGFRKQCPADSRRDRINAAIFLFLPPR